MSKLVSSIAPDYTAIYPKMIKVAGGSYRMGEKKDHKVNIQDFHIGQYPVTNSQFAHFLEAYGSDKVLSGKFEGEELIREYDWGLGKKKGLWKVNKGYEYHPVIGVSWYGAVMYCEWLSEQLGQTYRLPSEAEWEYSAKGGEFSNDFLYAGGNNLKEVGWNYKNSHKETKRVGLKLPNELGLYDMSGNIWDWCTDNWQDDYRKIPVDGSPLELKKEDIRVVRGGSWIFGVNHCCVSYRAGGDARLRNNNLGFRVSRY